MLTLPVVLNVQAVNLTDAQFYQLCQDNRDLQLERNAEGALVIMPSVGGISGNRESDLNGRVWLWNENTKLGKGHLEKLPYCKRTKAESAALP
jgi:Uma2 family endonuclease